MKYVTVKYTLCNEPRMVRLICHGNPEEMKREYMAALKELHPEGGYVIKEVIYSSYNIEEQKGNL